MDYIDVFNGDADGIFSLIQLRKAFPVAPSQQRLVTGVKRDNALLQQVNNNEAQDALLHVLDVSFDKNSEDLKRLMPVVRSVFYCDHHQAKALFEHPKLTSVIELAPDVCTGLLVSRKLDGAYHDWAIAAAFGDGLDAVAWQACAQHGLTEQQGRALQELGVLVNYNGYGAEIEDLHFHPADLFRALVAYGSPFEVVQDTQSPFSVLQDTYADDMARAAGAEVLTNKPALQAVMLDDAAWARRISGTLGNKLAHRHIDKAIVIATPNGEGTFTISLRAPKTNLQGAGELCGQFKTGGGRAGAAGINALPEAQLGRFMDLVARYYG